MADGPLAGRLGRKAPPDPPTNPPADDPPSPWDLLPADDEPAAFVVDIEVTNEDGTTEMIEYRPGEVPGLVPGPRLTADEIREAGEHYRGLARMCSEMLAERGAAGVPTASLALGFVEAAEEGEVVEAMDIAMLQIIDRIRRSSELIARRALSSRPRLAVEHVRAVERLMAEGVIADLALEEIEADAGPADGDDHNIPRDSLT